MCICVYVYIQSTPLNRVTSGPGYFDPIKRRNLLTENMLFLGYNCIFIRMLLEYEHIDSGFIIIRLTIQSTPLNRVTSGPGYFDPINRKI